MSFPIRVPLALVLGMSLTTVAVAGDGVALSRLAASAGYTYHWSATESGVTLQRRGLVIVLHAGYSIYQINTATAQADRAPEFSNGDMFVSTALAEHLRRLASEHPNLRLAPPEAKSTDSASPATGALTMSARQVVGSETIRLSGSGPPNVLVTITLTGELSRDIPFVLIARTTVMSAPDGSFSVLAPIGQDMHPGSTIDATATSVPGVSTATARVVVGAPSPGAASTLDGFPPK